MKLLPASHTTSSGVIVYHCLSGAVIVISDGMAIHLTDTEWRELVQYGMARGELVAASPPPETTVTHDFGPS